jgi:riboflavin kinase/FMN adenylyltransferase
MIQVHKNLNDLPKFKNAVVTIGTFDGVHLGHQQIINQLNNEAASINGETVIITFHPHPRKIVSGGTSDVKILTTLEEKIELLNKHGVQHLVVVPFTDEFSEQSAEEYVKDFIVSKFQPHTIIIGYDHHYGKGRKGDYHLLEKMGEQYGYTVKEISEHILNEITISSTKIRGALLHNDITTANAFIGHKYFFSGVIIEGDKIGRTIGYPTANIKMNDEEKLVPGDGVYAVDVILNKDCSRHKGMMYIGTRPVVNGKYRVIEVNIFDFDKDIYGETLKVELHHFIREDLPFKGLEELKVQLRKDKEATLAKLRPGVNKDKP